MGVKEELLSALKPIGVSAREQGMAAYLRQRLAALGIESETDANGNVSAWIRSGNPNAGTLLLEAHMDQIGWMVSGVDEQGFLKFVNLGGIDARILCGLEVLVHGEIPYRGVIGIASENKEKAPAVEDMRIDVGLSRAEAERRIHVGDAVSIQTEIVALAGDRLAGAAMDNRAGVASILAAVEGLKDKALPVHLALLFSTGEELGLQGAYTASVPWSADAAIVVDVTHGETPDAKGEVGVFPLGCGAVICRGPSLDDGYAGQLIALAQKEQIPYEIEVAPGNSGTTAWAMQTACGGLPTALISIPLRYMHTGVETLAVGDVQAVSDLLVAAVMGGMNLVV